jgi:hypothetical protein
MPESRIAQLASSPLLTNFAISASQRAIRPVGAFLFPLCEVPDINFRYKVYTEKSRYTPPRTKREIGGRATRIGFSADDASSILEPNALDFPIPNIDGLNDQQLEYSIMEGQSILADSSALALEAEQINLAVSTLTGGVVTFDWSNNANDPIGDATYGLDTIILSVVKAAKNGAPVKVLFGTNAFRKFRNNSFVKNKFIVGAGRNSVGTVSPTIDDVGGLLINNPKVRMSMMVIDNTAPGVASDVEFILDNNVIVFASNDAPNRMDASFGKTFARMGGFFKAGSYVTEDERDQVLKMDWTTKPMVTNAPAAQMIKMS